MEKVYNFLFTKKINKIRVEKIVRNITKRIKKL